MYIYHNDKMRIQNSIEQLKAWLKDGSVTKGHAVFSSDGEIEFVPLGSRSMEEKRGPGLGFHTHPLNCQEKHGCITPLPSQTDITNVLAEAATRGEFILTPYGIFFLSAEDIALDEDRQTCTGPICKAVTAAFTQLRQARKPEHAYRAFMSAVPSLSDNLQKEGMKLSFWPVNFDDATHIEIPGFTPPIFPTPPFKLPDHASMPLTSGIVVGIILLICTYYLSRNK